jgi:hypothetical protein
MHSTANAADARRRSTIVGQFVARYNEVRLHSAIGFVTPKDKLEGRDKTIFTARDRKLEAARAERKLRRHAARKEVLEQIPCVLQHAVPN